MPNKLKPFYLKKEDVPAGLVDAYEEKNGRWELIELDDEVPVVKTKLSLEETQRVLKEDLRKANEAKTRAEVSQLPAGKVAVDPEIETLGNAAKAAELKAEDIPGLKTKADELQEVIDDGKDEKLIDEVAKANGLNEKFVELAKDKKLKFEKKVEKDEEQKDVDVWYHVGEKDGKPENTKLDDFFEKDEFFSKFADTFTDSGEGENGTGGRKWVKQESGKDGKTVPGAQTTINNRYGKTLASLMKTSDE
ncbi:MAG: hypothetical protein ABWZ66_11785 [Pyrinomonadaceae bacterium]